MDYMYDGIDILDENLESARKSRTKIISIKKRLVFECADIFFMMPPWKRNSDGDKKFLCFLQNLLEQRIYEKMKKWEIRHPIMGIVICTILGGILISLIAGIILEGIMMV